MPSQSTSIPAQTNAIYGKTKGWFFGAIVIVVIAAGWKYPYLGLMVPVVMATGLTVGLFRGRYACGNICPRGSFLDTWMTMISGRRRVPALFQAKWFRGFVMVVLMGGLGWQLSQNIGSLEHWGHVFWQMCFLTTLVAVALGIAYRERAWCVICPMGSMQAIESRGRYQLQVSSACRSCHACEKVCPMDLPITAYRGDGAVKHPDCIKCSRCVTGCPATALSWPGSDSL